jgi:uncharacterized protein YkwD
MRMKKLIRALSLFAFLPTTACTTNNYYVEDDLTAPDAFPDPTYVDKLCVDYGYSQGSDEYPTPAEIDKMTPNPIQAPLSAKEMKALISNEAYDLLTYINQERVKRKLTKLTMNTSLSCAAQNHANDIGARKLCTHTGSNGSNFVERVKRCGYPYAHGEIVACGQKSARLAVDAWIKSSGHFAIMVDPNQKYFGSGWKNNYWVVVFSKK